MVCVHLRRKRGKTLLPSSPFSSQPGSFVVLLTPEPPLRVLFAPAPARAHEQCCLHMGKADLLKLEYFAKVRLLWGGKKIATRSYIGNGKRKAGGQKDTRKRACGRDGVKFSNED